jgi:hypothetical protein
VAEQTTYSENGIEGYGRGVGDSGNDALASAGATSSLEVDWDVGLLSGGAGNVGDDVVEGIHLRFVCGVGRRRLGVEVLGDCRSQTRGFIYSQTTRGR